MQAVGVVPSRSEPLRLCYCRCLATRSQKRTTLVVPVDEAAGRDARDLCAGQVYICSPIALQGMVCEVSRNMRGVRNCAFSVTASSHLGSARSTKVSTEQL